MDTKELRELLEKATPGPWAEHTHYCSFDYSASRAFGAGPDHLAKHSGCAIPDDHPQAITDAQLIAAAVNTLPALLDRVEELEDAASELLETADLRGDADLPHPEDDPKLWTARMQTAWEELRRCLTT